MAGGDAGLLFSEEELSEINEVKRGADYVEVMCGCTCRKYGDAVGRLRVFASGELEISCDCRPGCQEGDRAGAYGKNLEEARRLIEQSKVFQSDRGIARRVHCLEFKRVKMFEEGSRRRSDDYKYETKGRQWGRLIVSLKGLEGLKSLYVWALEG